MITLSEQLAHSAVDLRLKEISEFIHGSAAILKCSTVFQYIYQSQCSSDNPWANCLPYLYLHLKIYPLTLAVCNIHLSTHLLCVKLRPNILWLG